MAINSVAARNAYGIPNNPPHSSQIDPAQAKARMRDSLQELSDITYSRNVIVKAQAPAEQAANSEAATTGFSQVLPSPQKLDETRVKSLLAGGEDGDVPLPQREEIEALARRYLKVTGSAATGKSGEEKLKQLADFYGANPDRAQRFNTLVQELERGQEPVPVGAPSVAVA